MTKINIKDLILFLILVCSIELWSYYSIDLDFWKTLQIPMMLWMVVYFILKPKRFTEQMHFKVFILLFMLLPLLSIYPCQIYNNQSYDLSFIILRRNLFWLFYFILHYLKVTKKDALRIVIFISIVYVIVEIIQQFSYPTIYFSQRIDFKEKEMDIRMGLYRYYIYGLGFCLLSLFYFIEQFVIKHKMKFVYISSFFAIGVFFCLTRQIIIATVFCIMLSGVIGSNNRKNLMFFVISSFSIFLIYIFRDKIFGELVKTTTDQIDDNVRYLTYDYFLNHWNHWSCFVFGNGIAHDKSDYGKLLEYLSRTSGMFLNDIGIVGILYQMGVIYVLVFLSLYYTLFRKMFKYIDLYLKLYIILSLLIVPMIFPFWDGNDFIFFSLLLYLIDLSIIQNKKQMTLSIKKESVLY